MRRALILATPVILLVPLAYAAAFVSAAGIVLGTALFAIGFWLQLA